MTAAAPAQSAPASRPRLRRSAWSDAEEQDHASTRLIVSAAAEVGFASSGFQPTKAAAKTGAAETAATSASQAEDAGAAGELPELRGGDAGSRRRPSAAPSEATVKSGP